ncbi:MAG: hypothetical protein QM737_04025 [Ferruginibacter sp.]
MKNSIILLLFLAFTINAIAQKKQRASSKFKGDISMGYSRYQGKTNIPNGFLFSLETKYEVMEMLDLGLRVEMISLARSSPHLYYSYETDDDVTLKFHNSFLLTGDFNFSKIRLPIHITSKIILPFIGAGAGIHLISSDPFHESKTTVSKFGEMVRAGIELKYFRMAVEYNFVPRTKITSSYVPITTGNRVYVQHNYSNSYLSIKLGFCFGGGKK